MLALGFCIDLYVTLARSLRPVTAGVRFVAVRPWLGALLRKSNILRQGAKKLSDPPTLNPPPQAPIDGLKEWADFLI
jgi:hypothetical protein